MHLARKEDAATLADRRARFAKPRLEVPVQKKSFAHAEGGKWVSNRDEALRKFVMRKIQNGESLTPEQKAAAATIGIDVPSQMKENRGASTVRSTVNAGGPLVKWKPANRPLMQEARRQQKQGKQQRQQGGKRQQNYAGRNQQVVQKPVNRRRVRTEPHSRLKPQLKSDSQQHSVLCPESEASTGNTALVEPVQPPKNKLRNLRKKLRQIDALATTHLNGGNITAAQLEKIAKRADVVAAIATLELQCNTM